MGRARSTKGGKRYAYRILVGKPEGKRLLGRPTRRCLDNIEIGLRDRVVWTGFIRLKVGACGWLL
jgi:hypothetical protein